MSNCIRHPGYIRKSDGRGVGWFEGKQHLAHRIAWRKEYGKWPEGILRHTCDNVACVNVEHLIDGTLLENQRDAIRRDRRKDSKFTFQQIRDIRNQMFEGCRNIDLARFYGVSRWHMNNIRQNKAWIDQEA